MKSIMILSSPSDKVCDEICPLCTHTQDALFTVIFVFIGVPCIRKKLITEQNIGMNYMLTPLVHRYPPDVMEGRS